MKGLIIIPTYNEKDNIEAITKAVLELPYNFNVLIVDDNSPDGTGVIADRLSSNNNLVHVIHNSEKKGIGPAYIKGFKWGLEKGYDILFEMDADFSHDPKEIPNFLEKIKEYDLVIGSRNVPGGASKDWTVFRKLISKGGSLYSRIILGVDVKDFTGGFNMYRKEALERVNLDKIKSEGYAFAIEIKYRVIKAGAKFCEVPIIFPNRKRGKAKMTKEIFLEAMLRVWQMRIN